VAKGSYKMVPVEGTVSGFVSDGFGELASLKEEMDEMEGNMSSNNMEHLPKYEVITSAQEALSEAEDEPEVPDCVSDLKVSTGDSVNRDKRRGPSRAVRCSNATGRLSAVVDALNEWLDDEANAEHEDKDEVEALRDKCQEVGDNADGAEFPTMFG
jgi:hypothetical protein